MILARTCLLLAFILALAWATPAAPQPITDPSLVFTEPNVARPAYLSPFADPTFRTRVERIAGDPGASMAPASGAWGAVARHVYSKQQPWSSDGSLIVIMNDGNPTFLDGNSYQPLPGPCPGSIWDFRWHPSRAHPHELINVDASGTTLEWFDVVSCTRTRSWSLPFAVADLGSGEGNPSNDGRFVVLGSATQMFVVDMDPQPPFAAYPSQRIGPPVTIAPNCGASDCSIDWVSVSASGKYAVINYNGDSPRVFDVDPQTLALTPHVYAASTPECNSHDPASGFILDLGHADFEMNPFDNNEDVLIGQQSNGCPSSINGQPLSGVVMVRLRDGFVTMLTDPGNEAYPHHISTRNLERPGWAYVSYLPSPGQRFSDEIVAVRLDGSKACERVAHMHSDANACYLCEPHAVPSRDGQRVMFASTWSLDCGSGCGSTSDIKDYVVSYQAGPPPPPPPPPPASGDTLTLAIQEITPNPTQDVAVVDYRLAGHEPAELTLLDAAGRIVERLDLGAPGPGRYQAQLKDPGILPGIYWVWLSQAGHSVASQVVFLR